MKLRAEQCEKLYVWKNDSKRYMAGFNKLIRAICAAYNDSCQQIFVAFWFEDL
jgi:hypothetical protein